MFCLWSNPPGLLFSQRFSVGLAVELFHFILFHLGVESWFYVGRVDALMS